MLGQVAGLVTCIFEVAGSILARNTEYICSGILFNSVPSV
jgi:hypothetical protein